MIIYECIALRTPHSDRLSDESDNSLAEDQFKKPLSKTIDHNASIISINSDTDIEDQFKKPMNKSMDPNISIISINSDSSIPKPKVLFNETSDSNMSGISENIENQTPNISALDSSELSEFNESYVADPAEPYLGTRPLIPDQYELSEEYNHVMEIFFICTNELPEDRPSAAYLGKFLASIVK